MMKNNTVHRFLSGIFIFSLLVLLFGFVCWGIPMGHAWYSNHLLIRFGVPIVAVGAALRELSLTAALMSRLKPSDNEAAHSRLQTIIHSLKLSSFTVRLIEHDAPIAFCVGLFRPVIIISTGLVERLSAQQLKAVVLHEVHHAERYDPLRTLAADTLRAALFFLPAIHEWHSAFKARLEVGADSYAVQQVGKAALAGALHRLLVEGQPAGFKSVAGAGLSVNALRVANLLGEPYSLPVVSNRSLLLSSLILWVLGLLMV